MTVYPRQNYSDSNDAPKYEEYDLNAEKQRIAEGTEEIKKELLEKWNKRYADAQIFPDAIATMDPALISLLLSFQNTLFYDEIAKKFGFNQQQRDTLPQIVWAISKNKNWSDLEMSLQSKLGLDQTVLSQVAQLLNNQILLKAKEFSQTPSNTQQNTVNLRTTSIANTVDSTLSVALKAYPEIGEQLITMDRINIKSFPEPARPSVKNWLADYTFLLGYGSHSAIERGNYLFQGANAKTLNSKDRERLAYILKSFDENTLITIDKSAKQIVFPESNSSEPSSNDARRMPRSLAPEQPQTNKISYSSPQKMPYERMKSQPYKITPQFGKQKEINSKFDERPLGKNVVNLREQ